MQIISNEIDYERFSTPQLIIEYQDTNFWNGIKKQIEQ
jgi:hypothetical protein